MACYPPKNSPELRKASHGHLRRWYALAVASEYEVRAAAGDIGYGDHVMQQLLLLFAAKVSMHAEVCFGE